MWGWVHASGWFVFEAIPERGEWAVAVGGRGRSSTVSIFYKKATVVVVGSGSK